MQGENRFKDIRIFQKQSLRYKIGLLCVIEFSTRSSIEEINNGGLDLLEIGDLMREAKKNLEYFAKILEDKDQDYEIVGTDAQNQEYRGVIKKQSENYRKFKELERVYNY